MADFLERKYKDPTSRCHSRDLHRVRSSETAKIKSKFDQRKSIPICSWVSMHPKRHPMRTCNLISVFQSCCATDLFTATQYTASARFDRNGKFHHFGVLSLPPHKHSGYSTFHRVPDNPTTMSRNGERQEILKV
jgi:hypothetical protein